MKISSKLQKEYDKVMKKIEEAGLEVKDGKVIGYKKIMHLSINTKYYSHYDGYTNDAIIVDDYDGFTLSEEAINDMKKMDRISFNVIPDFNDPDDMCDVSLKINYKGKEMGQLFLERWSEFTESWKEYKKLPFKKVSDKEWVLDNMELNFSNEQEEHISGKFEIIEIKKYK